MVLDMESDHRFIAVYARKSKVTETGKSIDNQIEKCKAYAKYKYNATDQDWIVYQDEGLSGFYSDRPQYMKMLHDIQHNKIKAVICYKFDRISRKTIDLLNLVEELNSKNIAFVSCTDDVDTRSKNGKLIMAMLASIAEFERDIIAERIADNMYELAKDGRWLGGVTPTGFRSRKEEIRIRNHKSAVYHLEPVGEEQRLVKRIFSLFLQERSLGKVAENLNAGGIKTKKNALFTRTSVHDILTNIVYVKADRDMLSYFQSRGVPVYANEADFDGIHGLMGYGKTEQTKEKSSLSTVANPKYVQKCFKKDMKQWIISVGKHEGLISGKEWLDIQSQLREIKDKFARPHHISKSILSGLMKCPECGSNMYVRTQSGRFMKNGDIRYNYICAEKYKSGRCGSRQLKGNELDEIVIQEICKLIPSKSTYYRKLMETRISDGIKNEEEESTAIEQEIKKLETAIQEQIKNLRIAPDRLKQSFFKDLEELTNAKEVKQKRLVQIQAATQGEMLASERLEEAKRLLFDFSYLMNEFTYQQKSSLANRIIQSVVVDQNNIHVFLKGTNEDVYF